MAAMSVRLLPLHAGRMISKGLEAAKRAFPALLGAFLMWPLLERDREAKWFAMWLLKMLRKLFD